MTRHVSFTNNHHIPARRRRGLKRHFAFVAWCAARARAYAEHAARGKAFFISTIVTLPPPAPAAHILLAFCTRRALPLRPLSHCCCCCCCAIATPATCRRHPLLRCHAPAHFGLPARHTFSLGSAGSGSSVDVPALPSGSVWTGFNSRNQGCLAEGVKSALIVNCSPGR